MLLLSSAKFQEYKLPVPVLWLVKFTNNGAVPEVGLAVNAAVIAIEVTFTVLVAVQPFVLSVTVITYGPAEPTIGLDVVAPDKIVPVDVVQLYVTLAAVALNATEGEPHGIVVFEVVTVGATVFPVTVNAVNAVAVQPVAAFRTTTLYKP